MARYVQSTSHSRPSVVTNAGKYNRIQQVGASTTFEPTGSNMGKAFIVAAGTAYQIWGANGGHVTGSAPVTAGRTYEVGVKRVETGAGTTVYILS
tara:strand:+ start:3056 stop:3340 length:285 start_codon:yes stop_codon:yes gene_type:complete